MGNNPNNTTVSIRKDTHARLKRELKQYGDTFEGVIVRLLDEHESKQQGGTESQ